MRNRDRTVVCLGCDVEWTYDLWADSDGRRCWLCGGTDRTVGKYVAQQTGAEKILVAQLRARSRGAAV